nr:alpha-(1,3)-fucosyltransferase C-like [Procambarus clarkii]
MRIVVKYGLGSIFFATAVVYLEYTEHLPRFNELLAILNYNTSTPLVNNTQKTKEVKGDDSAFIKLLHEPTSHPLASRIPQHEVTSKPPLLEINVNDSHITRKGKSNVPNVNATGQKPVSHMPSLKTLQEISITMPPLSTNSVNIPQKTFVHPPVSEAPQGISTVRPLLELGDSNLPYDDLNPENITSKPVDVNYEKFKNMDKLDPYNPPLKKILFWNEVFGDQSFWFGFGREPFLRAGCPVNTCMTTSNRSRFPLKDIDAVLFHYRSGDISFPKERFLHTRYVFWLMESPAHLFRNIEPYTNIFNWTFTYRLDSDFAMPYGRVYRRRKPLEPIDKNYAANKTKMAAWFVSNCNTIGGRKVLVSTLRQWLQIDQYGGCGELKCGKHEARKCYAMLSANYKFYFSFENSLCRDYVTEKLFNILRVDVVPVVYGLANLSVQAPPHSYIDALSFPTAKALADYLIYLNNNDTAYNEYFRWKRFHQIPSDWLNFAKPYCDMCERLHNDNTTKMYDLLKWYVDDAHCKTRHDKDISNFISGR